MDEAPKQIWMYIFENNLGDFWFDYQGSHPLPPDYDYNAIEPDIDELGTALSDVAYIRADLHLARIRDLENAIETALATLKSSRFVNAEHARAMGILGNAVKGTSDE